MIRRLAAALLFAGAFLVQYQWRTVPWFGYWGFGPLNPWEWWVLPAVMALPALALPPRVDKPSALLAVLNYGILYVPLCVLLFHSTRTALPFALLALVWTLLALAAVALGVAARVAAFPLPHFPLAPRTVVGLAGAAVALTVGLAVASAPPHLIGLGHIYDARARYSAGVRPLGPWFNYLDAWSTLAFLPFLLALAFRRRDWAGGVGLALVCGLLFLASGRKTDLLCPVVVLAASGAARRRLGSAGVLALLSLALLAPFALGAAGFGRAALDWGTVVNFRVFAVPQVLVPQYYAYYLSHGYTYFRHINLVNRLFYGGRPFEQPWLAVAQFYYHSRFTADAVFYATDGLAALGPLGLPLITAAVVAVFWVLDGLAREHSPVLVLPALMPFVFSLFNNSLFTTLLTGGGLALMLLLFLYPAP